MTDIVERLRACENDPMWADHAEIPKLWCKEAADEIGRLRALNTEMYSALDQMVRWMPSGFAPQSKDMAMQAAHEAMAKYRALTAGKCE